MDQCLNKMNIDQNEVNTSNDTNSVKEVTLSTPWPNVISLVLIFISSLGIIYAGYIHRNMHLLTTLKNATNS